jgi:hypothetical protein
MAFDNPKGSSATGTAANALKGKTRRLAGPEVDPERR